MAVLVDAKLIRETAAFRNNRWMVDRLYKAKADTSLEAQRSALAIAGIVGLMIDTATTSTVSEDSSRLWWQTAVTYAYPPDGVTPADDPCARPAIVTYGFDTVTEDYFKDTTDKAVINAAGETYESQPQRKRSTLTIGVTKNIAATAFSPLSLCAIANTTNSAAVTIKGVEYPAGTLLMSAPGATEQYETSQGTDTKYHFYAVTYTLTARVEGWTDDIMECGYHELIGGKWVPILDSMNVEVSKPYPLTAAGLKGTPNSPVYTSYVPYKPDAWAGVVFT